MREILILDIETTYFLQKGGSIIEIGIVSLDLDSGKIKEIFASLLREKILTGKHREKPFGWIFDNSDITHEMVRHAPNAEGVLKNVQGIINDFPFGCTAYNNQFDFGFLKNRGIKFKKELPCPMKLSTGVCKIPNRNGYSGYKWPSCEEAYKFFFPGSEYSEKHRGLDDAKHEAEIVYKLYKDGIFKI